ncbi:MAG: DUF2817 domain-containing protein [Planctomycetaceae bacterium]|nr:DUF2817 domain-containing protein [Planctomycetaceae bacterium]
MSQTSLADFFSPDYATARRRFREAATRRGWKLSAYPIAELGPAGEELTIDVAVSPGSSGEQALAVSGGVHGVEGFLGSAVQLSLLERERLVDTDLANIRVVLIHGFNPYGFAWLRRTNENNVDLNRNFHRDPADFLGAPPAYAQLDSLLNPSGAPRRWELFPLKLAPAVLRHGFDGLRRIIVEGQHEFPQGLFFGGSEPQLSRTIFAEHLDQWLGGASDVAHLDLHTGLGRWGECQLLCDYLPSPLQRRRLQRAYGAVGVDLLDAEHLPYLPRGGFGAWCAARPNRNYLYACAEFGTYSGYQMLCGMRRENQLHRFASDAPVTHPVKRRIKELYCPSSIEWRRRTVECAGRLVDGAVRMLAELGDEGAR